MKKEKKQGIEKLGWKIGFVRDTKRAYANILQELRLNDHENYRKYLRMNTDTFQVALTTFVHLRHEWKNRKKWNSKKMKKEEILVFRVLEWTLPN